MIGPLRGGRMLGRFSSVWIINRVAQRLSGNLRDQDSHRDHGHQGLWVSTRGRSAVTYERCLVAPVTGTISDMSISAPGKLLGRCRSWGRGREVGQADPCGQRPSLSGQEEVPSTPRLALALASSGAAGVSRDGLARALRLPFRTLENLLKALVVAAHVTVVQAGGKRAYRATG